MDSESLHGVITLFCTMIFDNCPTFFNGLKFGMILSRSRNSLGSMKYRLDLKNGNNSQQLLEVINQGIGDSLERQLDYAHAPTIAGHLNPRPAQQPPEVDDQQRQPDQQQSQGGIARTSAGPHL